MSNVLKYCIGILAVFLVLYLSLDLQNLDKHKASSAPANFNASDYAGKFWENGLPASINGAPQVTDLQKLLNENPDSAYEKYGHTLGISKTHYFMLKGKGVIEKVEDEYLVVAVNEKTKIKIATDFIYGNAVRDGSGKVNIDDFLNMTEFNKVEVAINQLVKEKVVSRLKKSAKAGNRLEFAGAVGIGEENTDLETQLIIPVSIKLSDGKSE
jgi:predicted lipoprotein